jgi:cytochrome c oxidase assembly protein subunit 15
MKLNRRRLLEIVAALGAISAYATIVLGGTVRGMGAGLACPDWPLCNGSAIPDLRDPAIVVEYAHRLAAALTSLSVLLTMVIAILWFRPERRLVTLSFMSFALLATQVAVGALTITSENHPVVVTIHLALGTATFASALIVALVAIWRATPHVERTPDARSSLDKKVHDADADESNGAPDEPPRAAILDSDGQESSDK